VIHLSSKQLKDLTQLSAIAGAFGAEIVIVGAAALGCFVDIQRLTEDVDLVVALDLEAFVQFSTTLTEHGWKQSPNKEHRWCGPSGSLIDLLPAGPNLRAEQRIVWPNSQFTMSLIGFEHVFARAEPVQFAEGTVFKVIPPSVIALLKIVAFVDNPQRHKDLDDLGLLLRKYAEEGDRLFSDEVFEAALDDIEYANALLLGLDVGAIANNGESAVVNTFLRGQAIADDDLLELDPDDFKQRTMKRWHMQLRAFEQGFTRGQKRKSS
jgi:predicted nucleotidyltransferase